MWQLRSEAVRAATIIAVVWVVLAIALTGIDSGEGADSDNNGFADLRIAGRQLDEARYEILLEHNLWGDTAPGAGQVEQALVVVAIAGDSGNDKLATIIVDNEQIMRVTVGDVIEGKKVIGINSSEVLLEVGETIETLVLY